MHVCFVYGVRQNETILHIDQHLRKDYSSIALLNADGKCVTDPQDEAEALNNQFLHHLQMKITLFQIQSLLTYPNRRFIFFYQ